MNIFCELSRISAKLRFKLFRFISILLLGREGGQSIIGQCISSDLEFANTKIVRDHILKRNAISGATVQNYQLEHIPECWKAMFCRTIVFPPRYAYVMKDVAIGPDSGVMFVPPRKLLGGDGVIFIPSVGNHYYFFMRGIQEVMRKARSINEALPVFPMPTIGYYHELLEGLLRVQKARECFGEIKILVPMIRPKYIDEMLEFIGVAADGIMYSDCPIIVPKGALIPRWSDNLKEDICEFHDYLVSRLPGDCNGAAKLYISRARSRRSLPSEHEIEKVLADKGFSIAYFEDMSFVEQLKAVRAADVIVSPHGAGLANIIVAKPGTKVVEIMTQGWANSCYGHLASSLGLDYTCIDAGDGSLIERLTAL